MIRQLIPASLCLVVLMLSEQALAGCRFDAGSAPAQLDLTLPASLSVPPNAAPGTELWSSGWQSSGVQRIVCSLGDSVSVELDGDSGLAVPEAAAARVFRSGIQGVGIALTWCEGSACDEAAGGPLAVPGAGVRQLQGRWRVRLLKTGPTDSAGILHVPGQAVVRYGDLALARLRLLGSSRVRQQGCELNPGSQSITVALPEVSKGDLAPALGALADSSKARAFGIDLLCDSGVQVIYRIDAVGAAGDILANARGVGMASGVGVQLLQGAADSSTPQPLGAPTPFGSREPSATARRIPLAARYFRTARQVTGGWVRAAATFTLTYE